MKKYNQEIPAKLVELNKSIDAV